LIPLRPVTRYHLKIALACVSQKNFPPLVSLILAFVLAVAVTYRHIRSVPPPKFSISLTSFKCLFIRSPISTRLSTVSRPLKNLGFSASPHGAFSQCPHSVVLSYPDHTFDFRSESQILYPHLFTHGHTFKHIPRCFLCPVF